MLCARTRTHASVDDCSCLRARAGCGRDPRASTPSFNHRLKQWRPVVCMCGGCGRGGGVRWGEREQKIVLARLEVCVRESQGRMEQQYCMPLPDECCCRSMSRGATSQRDWPGSGSVIEYDCRLLPGVDLCMHSYACGWNPANHGHRRTTHARAHTHTHLHRALLLHAPTLNHKSNSCQCGSSNRNRCKVRVPVCKQWRIHAFCAV